MKIFLHAKINDVFLYIYDVFESSFFPIKEPISRPNIDVK